MLKVYFNTSNDAEYYLQWWNPLNILVIMQSQIQKYFKSHMQVKNSQLNEE